MLKEANDEGDVDEDEDAKHDPLNTIELKVIFAFRLLKVCCPILCVALFLYSVWLLKLK